jgi:hypothetical protein
MCIRDRAKSNLASGFDVEYVKSNLLRIPNIEVVDYGTGIRPSECSCLVIVSNSTFDPKTTKSIKVGKEISKAIQDFSAGNSKLSNVFVYCGTERSTREDIEPIQAIGVASDETIINEAADWKEYADLMIDHYVKDPLLVLVSKSIGTYPSTSWRKYPRHYKPAPGYEMPPIPSYDDRRAVKLKKGPKEDPKVTGVSYLERNR